MDLNDCPLSVLIQHQTHEGKHHYEVESVVKRHRGFHKKMLVRKGDKLIQVNGRDLEDLTPEELAQILTEGSPMLTLHKPGKKEEQPPNGEDVLRPVSKETTVLSFAWEMTQEDASEDNKVEREVECKKWEDVQEECSEGGDLLVIEMTQTSITLVSGRSCDSRSPCGGCNESGCVYNDIVVVSETSRAMLVPRGGAFLKQSKQWNRLLKHFLTHRYIRGICSERVLYASPNPERITIYSYKWMKESDFDLGVPVVLNLTESNCFLRCCMVEGRVLLQVEACEKEKLRQISETDENAFSYVFYMKGYQPYQRTFQSALYRGWFIQIVNTDQVEVKKKDSQTEEETFLFIIQP